MPLGFSAVVFFSFLFFTAGPEFCAEIPFSRAPQCKPTYLSRVPLLLLIVPYSPLQGRVTFLPASCTVDGYTVYFPVILRLFVLV